MMKVTLVNGNGTRYDVTVKDKIYLHSLEGLGYATEIQYARLNNRHKVKKEQLSQATLKGTIKFWGATARTEYQNFVKFCQKKPMYMLYKPLTEEYRRDVIVTTIGMSESNCLQCSVELECLSPPYKLINVMTRATTVGGGKIYDYRYPYTYRSTANNSVVINSDSYIPSPCKLTIYGPMTNPRWTHYVNNHEVATGRVIAVIPIGHRIEISTETIPYSILQYDEEERLVADLYQSSDFGTDRFMTLEYGENKITVGDDGANEVNLKAEGMIEYASV